MNFNYVLQNNNIHYGVLRGNGSIVFIKAGLGGDYLGYENKYLKMACRLNEQHGCSVIAASNPHDGKKHSETDKLVIEQYVAEQRFSLPELYFFGHSNGGTKGLELTNAGIRFKKMILVNMPLMLNLHKTRRYIDAIPETSILAVYGESDPSFPYVPFLDGKWENVKAITVPKADHNFKGLSEELIGLSDFFMREG